MVLYFSGTGNSRYTAEMISKITGDELVSMNALIKAKNKESHYSDRPYVFVTPVYAGRIPKIVEQYIRETAFEGMQKVYFVVTCADTPWVTDSYVKKLCDEKQFALMGFNSVVMPQGYVAMGSTKSAGENEKTLKKADPRIKSIADQIADGQMLDDEKPGKAMMSKMINPIMYAFMVNAKGFRTTDVCIGCGTCAHLCPLNNIKLVNNRPVWEDNCTHCMACIAGCPQKAVEYGKKSVGATRYYNTKDPQV